MIALRDLLYSARSLARTPSLVLALLISLALGIGSNAIVLSFIRGFAAQRVPIEGIGDVLSIFSRDSANGFAPLSLDDFRKVETARSFSAVGAVRESESPVEFNGRSILAASGTMTAGVFKVLRLPAGDGVFVTPRFWQNEMGAPSPREVQKLRVDGRESLVAGIMPPGFDGLYLGRQIDVWVPLDETSPAADRQSPAFWVVARLTAGTTRSQADRELRQLAAPATWTTVAYTGVEPDVAGGFSRLRTLLLSASIIVFLIGCANVASLLLSRASSRTHETSVRVALGASRGRLTSQLLADAVVIAAAGAAAGALTALWTTRVLPSLLFDQDAESLVLAPDRVSLIVGLGLCIAITTIAGLSPLNEVKDDDPATVLRRERGGLSNASRRLRAGLVVAQMTCGCVLLISTGLLMHGFQASLRTTAGRRLATSILATVESRAGFGDEQKTHVLFAKTETAVMKIPGVTSVAWTGKPPGARPAWQRVRIEPVTNEVREVTARVDVLPPRKPAVLRLPALAGRMFGGRDTATTCGVLMANHAAATTLFDDDAVGRLVIDPSGRGLEVIGVVDVAPTANAAPSREPALYYYENQQAPPAEIGARGTFRVNMRPRTLPVAMLDANVVSASYFDLTGAKVVSGLSLADDPAGSRCRSDIAVINEEAASLYFGGKAAGRTVLDELGQRVDIVGVIHDEPLRATARRTEPSIFFPMSQRVSARMTMIVSATSSDDATVAGIREAIERVTGIGTATVRTLERHFLQTSMATERVATMLVAVCAGSAVVLCIIGVYGAMADSVRQRRREIAMTVALGAPWWRVAGTVFGEGLQLAAGGAIAGSVLSILIARWLAQVTPGAGAATIWVWLAAPLLLGLAVVAGSLMPAVRAVTVDPLVVMREE